MIHTNSFSAEWLEYKRQESGRDPGLIEKMIYALHLVEQLQVSGLPFIFKGGTSLVLLMTEPRRFSVDIDIVVAETTTREELEHYLQKVTASSTFIRVELDERRSYKGEIPKAHYKFIYTSNVPNKRGHEVFQKPEAEILLDVLFAENPYPAIVEKPVLSSWLENNGDPVYVSVPCINSITGDKMVAFAPCTTGVPYFAKKEREIIKQLFDVGNLFDQIDDVELVRKAYHIAATAEMKYRSERNIASIEQILQDTIDTALLLATPKCAAGNEAKLEELRTGIKQFTHFVFDQKGFKVEDALLSTAKAAYLAAYLLKGETGPLKRFDKATFDMKTFLIAHQEFNFLNKKIKFVKGGEALFYWFHTINLLHPPLSEFSLEVATTTAKEIT
ncbi:nucleotidyl transferase AbiEii/AbiGii toxin family protein [Chitinophaga sp. G-6-1-13]|uniref:Nucleotidyl transferase AbiEii/AbiGii toxin family protein n=1 Tax=Chitinophaga fulva TaxID=2728842 RepID=A0A848GIR6_9BACT|nr:nucleotidyl transferase AbiEii/AbiGii toxin family protein [Chitinophaga fulva]NML37591.1 nucleotidyl transferase AbiEii/AbiGii toxin family protein [Chitinophaga fulva]